MTNFVFIHGGNVSGSTWNQVVQQDTYPININLGGQIWTEIAAQLKVKSHSVYTPTLTNEYKNSLSDHIEQVCCLIKENQLNNVILIAHSYGGMIITGVAEKPSYHIDQLVYLDAALPKNGQSLFDLLKLGNLEPNLIIQGTPKAYTEKIKLSGTHNNNLKRHYVRCLESDFTCVTTLAKQIILADFDDWNFQEINAGHLLMATEPDWITDLLLSLTDNRITKI